MRDYDRKSINTGQAKPVGDFVTVAATIGVIAAGVALFEVALIPGMAIGAAAVLAPKYVPKLRRRLRPSSKLNRPPADRTRACRTGPTGRQGTTGRPRRVCDQTSAGQDHHVSNHRHDPGLHHSLRCGRQPRHGGEFVSLPSGSPPPVLSCPRNSLELFGSARQAQGRSGGTIGHWSRRSPIRPLPRPWTSPLTTLWSATSPRQRRCRPSASWSVLLFISATRWPGTIMTRLGRAASTYPRPQTSCRRERSANSEKREHVPGNDLLSVGQAVTFDCMPTASRRSHVGSPADEYSIFPLAKCRACEAASTQGEMKFRNAGTGGGEVTLWVNSGGFNGRRPRSAGG